MYIEQKRLKTDLRIFLGVVCALIVLGLIFVYSSSSVFALEKCGSAHYFVKKQCFGILLGFFVLLITRFLPLSLIESCSSLFYLGALGLTALTFVPGLTLKIHGSNRWLSLGGFSFQPSELLKITLLMYLAAYLTKMTGKRNSIKSYLPFLTLFGAGCLLLLKQPDFGMTVTLTCTVFLIFFIMQINTKLLLSGAALSIPVGTALIYMRSYRLKRITTFFNPWSDPQGSGFQLIQSLIAIGSGSWLGVGISNSRQKFFYLPMQHTDFIFAIIAEETGFIGALLIIFLYMLFLYFGMRIASKLSNPFAMVVTLGFVIMTSLQATINIAVTTGLLPTKGIGLPFISYGNSSLICSLAMIGLIMNCVAHNRNA
ncbi:MAG TPA: putative lipid II flippase FtsW [Candidatus Babeliales bacterium]|nr:putative lipid II flippase FtsW [Candidatus Babeliales bacterium]